MSTNLDAQFKLIIRKNFFSHFSICFSAFMLLWVSRYVGYRLADTNAMMLSASSIEIIMDFGGAVLLVTLLRVFYSLPFSFVRPSIGRIANFLFFPLAFGSMFSYRSEQVIGAKVEKDGIRFYYPYPRTAEFYTFGHLSEPVIRDTGSVSCIEYPDPKIHFIPISNNDTQSQKQMRLIFDVLKANKKSSVS